MYKTILLLVVIMTGRNANAQFSDSVLHHIKLTSTGVINKTNTGKSYVLSNGVNYNSSKKRTAVNASATWVYGASQNILTNNDVTAHADMNFFKPGQKLYYWALANFDNSYSLKINYRFQGGAGVSYNLIDSTYLRINLSDGFLYETGDITEGANRKEYTIPRNSFRLLYRWNIKDMVTISGINFYQPSLVAINDYIIQSVNNVSVKLYKWINLTATLTYNKLTATDRETLLFTYGLTLEKYF